ncbi:MAG: ribonuclease H-like domain-containing protein [Enhygromyxa sp.]
MSLLDRLAHARALDRDQAPRSSRPKPSPSSIPPSSTAPPSTAGFERRERTVELDPDPPCGQARSFAPRRADERSRLLGGCLDRLALPSAAALARDLVCLGAREVDRAVFLDTETTGLGSTVPFMVGIAWVGDISGPPRQHRPSASLRSVHPCHPGEAGCEPPGEAGQLHCVQWTMTRVSGEAELLADLLARLEALRPAPLVSFNGASFDLPLLRLRAHRYGLSARVLEAEHVDLLHPARRLHRGRGRDCRLATLERELLGVRRQGDIDSAEIPEVFWTWLQSPHDLGAQRRLRAVCDHNLVDLVSLPALAAWLAQTVREPADLDHALRAARHLERIGAGDQARLLLSRCVEGRRPSGPRRGDPKPAPEAGEAKRSAAPRGPTAPGAGEAKRSAAPRGPVAPGAGEAKRSAAQRGPTAPGAGEAKRSAAPRGPTDPRWCEAALELARLERRAGGCERAAELWRAAWLADPGCPEASEAWAKHLEHRLADFEQALRVARGSREPCERRIARLEARAARAIERRATSRSTGRPAARGSHAASEPPRTSVTDPPRGEGEPPRAELVELCREPPPPSVAGIRDGPLRAELVELGREPPSVAEARGEPGPQPLVPCVGAAPQSQANRRTELLARVDETEAGAVVRYRLLR